MTSAALRAQRIERRCIPAVREALHAGQISARSADAFLRLTPRKQATELARRLSETAERERRHRLVARTIRGYLDGLNGGRVDLHQLGGIIRSALV
jgi:hypothetical protein